MAFQYPGFQLNAFQIRRRANADALLPNITCEATGTVAVGVVGHADITLPALTCRARQLPEKVLAGGGARPAIPPQPRPLPIHGRADVALPSLSAAGRATYKKFTDEELIEIALLLEALDTTPATEPFTLQVRMDGDEVEAEIVQGEAIIRKAA